MRRSEDVEEKAIALYQARYYGQKEDQHKRILKEMKSRVIDFMSTPKTQ